MKNSVSAELPTLPEPLVFTWNNETLLLTEIIKTKKIISVTISYLTQKREIKAKGLLGFFGAKQIFPSEKKEIRIEDSEGITLECMNDFGPANIRFSRKEEFEKLEEINYDPRTLSKSYIMSILPARYMVGFFIENLGKVEWVNSF